MKPAVSGDEDLVTVFVVSAGEAVLPECLAALERQTRRFRIERIDDVYPMSAAFQAMPDRCRTPLFVQVDADMVLEPDAVETLVAEMSATGPRTATVSAQLFEEGFGPGGAVKCWRRSVFRFFRFRDVRTVDRDLYRRFRRWGLTRRHLETPIGVHRPRSSPESNWLKAKGDVEKWRFLGRPPERYALPLLAQIAEADPFDAQRLTGALLGALTTEPRLSRSKDLRYERELRDETIGLLGGASPQPALVREHLTGMRGPFADAYSGGERRRLAREIALIFSTPDPFAQLLLDLTDR